jgi:hypothetical protein
VVEVKMKLSTFYFILAVPNVIFAILLPVTAWQFWLSYGVSLYMIVVGYYHRLRGL